MIDLRSNTDRSPGDFITKYSCYCGYGRHGWYSDIWAEHIGPSGPHYQAVESDEDDGCDCNCRLGENHRAWCAINSDVDE